MGTLPRTKILLTDRGIVVGNFSSNYELAVSLGISVDMKTGIVTFMGESQLPRYITEDSGNNHHWKSSREIARDWSNNHLKLPCGYKTYIYLA